MEWCLVRKKSACTGYSPLVTRLLANRGVTTNAQAKMYFDGDLSMLHNPALLKDIDKGAKMIVEAIKRGWLIRIIGDYDVDGVCSTAILHRGLEALGARVSSALPHRIKDGYGMSERLIREAAAAGVKLLLTCDNGIAASDMVKLANSLGMTVIITDHHEVPYDEDDQGNKHYRVPDAFAVIDPKQEDCPYPFNGICGAVVAYKVIQYMYDNALMGDSYKSVYEDKQLREELLQWAALATVCDVMELTDENRIIVRYGLQMMTDSPAQGIRQLRNVQKLDDKDITVYHLGFIIGPCINAAGRLDSAERALSLLLCKNEVESMKIANDLRELNIMRISMTDTAVKEGIKSLDSRKVQVVYLPECHESIAGIVAGRLKEFSHKPVLVATRTVGRDCKGSGRSISAYPLYEEMHKAKDLFYGFGGHALAAGFSMSLDNIDKLRDTLNSNCVLTDRDVSGVVYADSTLHLEDANADLANTLETLGPFGTGNRKPVFICPNVRLISMKTMGKTGGSAMLTVKENGKEFVVKTFKQAEDLVVAVANKFGRVASENLMEGQPLLDDVRISIAFTVSWNEYNGVRSVQRVIEDFVLM